MGLVQAFDFLVADHVAAGRLIEVLPELQAEAPPFHALCARAGKKRSDDDVSNPACV